jgi:hypothetical protein
MKSEVAEHLIPQFVGWKRLSEAKEISARSGVIDESDCERLRKIFVVMRSKLYPRVYGATQGWYVILPPPAFSHVNKNPEKMRALEAFDAHCAHRADQIVKFYNTVAAYSKLRYPEIEEWVQETLEKIESDPIQRRLQANSLAIRIFEYAEAAGKAAGVKGDECPSILKIQDKKLRNEAFRAVSIRLKVLTAEWIVGARECATYLFGEDAADQVSEYWLGIHLGSKAFGWTKGGKPRRGAQFSMAISPDAKIMVARTFHEVLNNEYKSWSGYKQCPIMSVSNQAMVTEILKDIQFDDFGYDYIEAFDDMGDTFDIGDIPDDF